jgi:hypothetical protein
MSDHPAEPPGMRRMHAVRFQFVRHGGRSNAPTTAFILTIVVSLFVVGSLAMPLLEGRAGSLPQAGGPVTPAIVPQTLVPSNATDCGLVTSTYFNGTISSLGWPPSYATDSEIMFAKLCNDTAFVTLLSEWGGWHWIPPVTANGTTTPGYVVSANFTLQFGGSGWGNWTFFVVQWISWDKIPANVTSAAPCHPCQWVEYWTGSLPGTNYTGPNLTIYPVIYAGGPPSPGPSGPTGLFLVLTNVWFVCLLAAVVLAVAIFSLVVVRGRSPRRPPKSGSLARTEGEVRSGTAPPVPGQLPEDASPTHARQGIAPESSDPLDDAF